MRKSLNRIASIATSVAMVGSMLLAGAPVHADGPVSNMSDTLTREKIGVVAEHILQFTVGAGAPMTTATTITYPNFTAVASGSTTATTATCAGGALTVSFTGAGTSTAIVLTPTTPCAAGVLVTTAFQATNPATVGSYNVTLTGGATGLITIPIVAEDQIQVTATVGGAMSFNVGAEDTAAATCNETFAGNGGTVDFGTLTIGAIASSDVGGVNHICTRLSSNATHGTVVTVRSLNSGLQSISAPADRIPSVTAAMAAGTANYGLCASDTVHGVATTVPAGIGPVAVAPFVASCPANTAAGSVGALTTTPQTVWAVTGGVTNAFYNLVLKAAIGATTPAAADYADTLTFVATGTF